MADKERKARRRGQIIERGECQYQTRIQILDGARRLNYFKIFYETKTQAGKRCSALVAQIWLAIPLHSLYTPKVVATLTLPTGVPRKEVSEQMDHSTVEFTEDEYVTSLVEVKKLTSDRLENPLFEQAAHRSQTRAAND